MNQLLSVSGGCVKLGKKDNTYGWDNEFGKQEIEVKDFKASQFLVSNKEFLEFVDGDGYQNSSYWCEEGGQWLQSLKPSYPKFWVVSDGNFFLEQ